MTTKNLILLKKRLIHLTSSGQDNLAMAMSVNHQLMKYGFILSAKAFDMLKVADVADIKDFHDDVIIYLKEITGSTRNFKSLYGEFPRAIMTLDNTERWYLQMLHYWSNATFNVELETPNFEELTAVDYKEIDAVSLEDIVGIYVRLAGAGQALTPSDVDTLKWFATQNEIKIPAVDIPFKENLAVLFDIMGKELKVKTVTDVLRIATVISGGDPTLLSIPKNKTKRTSFSRFKFTPNQNALILNLFENSNLDAREMNTTNRYGRYIRLAEVLQVGKYKTIYPKTALTFYNLRNQKRKGKPDGVDKIRTWNYDVEQAFQKSFDVGLTKLLERPGEFMRRIDYLVRKNPKQVDLILSKLTSSVASNKVLFEVYTHFENRRDKNSDRSVFIKGARKLTKLPDLPALNANLINGIQQTIIECLQQRFAKQFDPMGLVYIDPELKKIPLPTNMRSLSESLTSVIRGQRMPIGVNSNLIRCYVHWFNDGTRDCDIDLSAFLANDKSMEQIGWNASSATSYALYSGDVTNRRGACAEYIDIDIEKALEAGYDMLLMDARDYRGKGFNTYKECVAGFSSIDNLSKSLEWAPNSLTGSVKITSKATAIQVMIVDLKSREYIWFDLDSTGNVASSDRKNIKSYIQKYASLPKLSIYDLLEWHTLARGGRKARAEDADIQFLFKDFSTDCSNILPWMGV